MGNVYLPIPPKERGMGQVEVMVQGRLRIVQALSDSDKKIGNRVAVRVTETIDDQTILVKPLEDELTSDEKVNHFMGRIINNSFNVPLARKHPFVSSSFYLLPSILLHLKYINY